MGHGSSMVTFSLRKNGSQILCQTLLPKLSQLCGSVFHSCLTQKIGNSIGKLLKVDACTSATLRGRYARLCVEIALDQPVKSHIQIGNHKQVIEYEGKDLLCKFCGRIGQHQVNRHTNSPNDNPKISTVTTTPAKEEWHTVNFVRKDQCEN
ncbi:hypothetical protein KY290_007791 [Solanum tuberosum]|uniref:Uncharacterized protein n=1 Tax=Solanum tuberosum TaxID=4113 RepID=A0ABQ7W6K8_SOLTU|nr:hypothetical protein KY290_007791 [Solanum tuberosum]